MRKINLLRKLPHGVNDISEPHYNIFHGTEPLQFEPDKEKITMSKINIVILFILAIGLLIDLTMVPLIHYLVSHLPK